MGSSTPQESHRQSVNMSVASKGTGLQGYWAPSTWRPNSAPPSTRHIRYSQQRRPQPISSLPHPAGATSLFTSKRTPIHHPRTHK